MSDDVTKPKNSTLKTGITNPACVIKTELCPQKDLELSLILGKKQLCLPSNTIRSGGQSEGLFAVDMPATAYSRKAVITQKRRKKQKRINLLHQ